MPLRRVDANRASDDAVGILIPPGARTVVVVRPRRMTWDLLPVRWSGEAARSPEFVSFDREQAAQIARRLAKSLEERDCAGTCPLETLGRPPAFQVWLRDAEFNWLLCERTPGQAYRPLVFPTIADAVAAAERLRPMLHPGPGRQQDYYFNTQQFS